MNYGAETDLDFSVQCLDILLSSGEANLPDEAKRLLVKRRNERLRLQQLAKDGAFEHMGTGVYYAELSERVNGELLPMLLPEATIILVAYPIAENKRIIADTFEVKARAGLSFAQGYSLEDLRLPLWGRWDAQSDGRNGGTSTPTSNRRTCS